MKPIVRNLLIIVLVIILCVMAFLLFTNVIYIKRENNILTKEAEAILKQNETPIFKIDQIILYSSAYATNSNEQESLDNLDIHQFTDIAIYIENNNNVQGLKAENTISQMYIDNIEIKSDYNTGRKALNYKNPAKFGVYENLKDSGEEIAFNVVHTNREKDEVSYNDPTFFTDTSDPITLGYVNKNIIRQFEVSEEKRMVAFDGTILADASIDLEKINSIVSFTVHIKNNFDEEYICNVDIDIDLASEDGGIYTGYIMRIINAKDTEFNFFKLAK